MSAAIINGRASSSFLSLLASLPAKVVLPAPCKPTIMIMVGIFGDLIISAVSEPRTAVNSSLTILMICWAGLRVSITSCPIARSRTFLIKSLTTGRATSASKRAKRISLVASWISLSVIFPFLRRFLKTFCKRSVKFSNAIIFSYFSIQWKSSEML